MPKVLKDKIVFGPEDWLSGLDPQFDASGLAQVGEQLPLSRSMNPYRYLGLLSPGYNRTDVANVSVVDNSIRKGVVSGNNAFCISTGDDIYQVETLQATPTITTPSTFPHAIDHAHASEAGSDVAIYTAKVGGTSATRLFYSFNDATDWDIGTYDLSTTFDDDFMSTAPATPLGSPYLTGGVGQPHPLIVGDDDILYVGDRNFLHGYDGANAADNDGKFFPAVLTLPNNLIITSFAKYNQYLVIFTYKNVSNSNIFAGESRAWFWDYLSLDPTYSVNLNDSQVSEGFDYKGTIGCFTQGRPSDQASVTSKVSKLCIFNGSQFEPVVAFDKNIPIRGGVEVKGDDIWWNSQGVVYVWDGKRKILNQVAEGTGTTSGMLATLNRTQFISSGTTTSGGLQTLSTNYFAQTLVYSGLARPDFPSGYKGQVTRVKVKFGKTSTGGLNVLLTLRDRISDIATIISSGDNLRTITSTNLVTEYFSTSTGTPLNSSTFDTLRAVVQWESGSGVTDAPIIDSIEVYYQLTAL